MKVTTSSEGARQGHPLASPAFRLAINPILKKCTAWLGDDGLVRAIEDDILIIGVRKRVLELLELLHVAVVVQHPEESRPLVHAQPRRRHPAQPRSFCGARP